MLEKGTISSFLGMNFTGSSTYTSLSGVRREMNMAVPAQLVAVAAGIAAIFSLRGAEALLLNGNDSGSSHSS